MQPRCYFIILLFSCNILIAQENFPSRQDNPKWKIVKTITSYPEIKITEEYQYEDDTLINSNLYHKITNDAGYIRQIESKVYYRMKDSDKDYLLYDFNLSVNDSVYCGFNLNETSDEVDSIKFWVVQVDSVELENGKHKR